VQNKAVFLDRDGVINKTLHNHPDPMDKSNYVLSWDQFEFVEDACAGIALLDSLGFKVLVASNQSGISRGYITSSGVDEIFAMMEKAVYVATGVLVQWLYCPHTRADSCVCHKPEPGLFYALAMLNDIDMDQSWAIGDRMTDLVSASRTGIRANRLIQVDENFTLYDAALKIQADELKQG